MKINITSRKFKIKDNLKGFISTQVNSLSKFNDELMSANVVLSYTHLKDSIKTAEILVQGPGQSFAVSESSDDYKKSVSSAIDKLARQIKKEKTKKISKKR